MMRKYFSAKFAAMIALVSSSILVTPIANAQPKLRLLGEPLLDRCSGDVFVSAVFNTADYPPNGHGILLQRGNPKDLDYGNFMRTDSRNIRWFCRSTIGNWFDVGTWRISDGKVYGTYCGQFEETTGSVSGKPCKPDISLKITDSARGGWTPERSKCPGATTYIQVRFDTDRKLRIRCYGSET